MLGNVGNDLAIYGHAVGHQRRNESRERLGDNNEVGAPIRDRSDVAATYSSNLRWESTATTSYPRSLSKGASRFQYQARPSEPGISTYLAIAF